MREIIFRGKRLDNGEWVEGYFVNLWMINYQKHQPIITDNNAVSYDVDPSTIGQYTGLKDKNGKRIFEGDILESRYDDLYPDDVSIEVVQWFRNGWYIRQGKNLPDALDEYGVLQYSEVIGNIHDNLVLLKEEGNHDHK